MEQHLDNAPCLYFTSADNGTIVEVNHTLCNQLGYTKEELKGQKLEMICTLATRIFQQTHLFPLLKMQGHAEEIFITLLARNKEEVPVLLNAQRQLIDGQQVAAYTGIVVRNRKKFEDELVAAKKAAEQSLHENTALQQAKAELQQRAEELDHQMQLVSRQNRELWQFNRVVTHDLQEPVRKLLLFTDLLTERKNEGASIDVIQKIRLISEKMRAIVSGLQQYVWLTETPLHFTSVDLSEIIGVLEQELAMEYPGVSIHINAKELPALPADKQRMQLLLKEIMSNAIRFRKQGNEATIHIQASSLLLNKFKTVSGKYKYAEHLKLEIKDEGSGFDNVYKDQVLELFKKFHPESGLGIGLSLCKKIVETHGGSISIDSQENEGTIVTIWLPLERKEMPLPENELKHAKR
ncbi:MAG TPA: ATP-binding protein [Chitinophagaceae bacterium]|nr:ATP-binding protein [Chitinophagaceae bacterium]